MKIRHFGTPIVLLSFALFIAINTDFSSVIGLLLCIAAIISSLERTISEYKEKNWVFFVLGIVLMLVSILFSAFYHGMMIFMRDFGPFYFPVSE